MGEPGPRAGERGRIVHAVASPRFAGVERYIALVAPRLAARGWRVDVVGGDPVRMAEELGPLVGHRPAADVRALIRALASTRADIVHSHMTDADLAAALTKPLHRARMVTTLHFAAPRGRSRPVRMGVGVAERFFDARIAISEFVRRAGDPGAVVVPNGVEAEQPGTGGCRVLVAQRLEHEKQTGIALEAWRLSGLGDRGWRLAIAGEGSERAPLEEAARRLGVDASVDFLGQRADIATLRRTCSIALATAPAEPFGLAVVEAMAAGLPVVAAAGGGHLETVGAVAPQLLFPPGDAHACAAILQRLAGDAAERDRLGAELRAHQAARFDIDDHVAALERIYQEVLGRG